MGDKLPRITASQIIKVLEKLGFEKSRSSGSHLIYRNEVGSRATSRAYAGSDERTS